MTLLTYYGYEVGETADGVEALHAARERRPHLIIADVVMPRMRGPELAKRLKRRLPDLKVVYMSGYTEEFSEGQSLLEGASFLQKPFSRDALLRQIHDTLKGKPAEQVERPTFSLRMN